MEGCTGQAVSSRRRGGRLGWLCGANPVRVPALRCAAVGLWPLGRADVATPQPCVRPTSSARASAAGGLPWARGVSGPAPMGRAALGVQSSNLNGDSPGHMNALASERDTRPDPSLTDARPCTRGIGPTPVSRRTPKRKQPQHWLHVCTNTFVHTCTNVFVHRCFLCVGVFIEVGLDGVFE